MPKPYEDLHEEPLKVQEPAIDLRYLESPTDEKIKYLSENLHPSTVAYLEQFNFMKGQDFPYNEDELDDDWTNEPDEANPIVPEDIVLHDREVWLNVR